MPNTIDNTEQEDKSSIIPEGEAAKSFFGKFSAKKNAPPDQGGDIQSEINQNRVEQITKENEQKKELSDQDKADAEKVKQKIAQEQKDKAEGKKKPGSNVPELLEKKRLAEARVAELEPKIVGFETTIKELQAKIDSGDFSAKKEQEWQEKITTLEIQVAKDKETLVNENKKLLSRLTYHDLQEDPEFQKNYIAPVVTAYQEAVEIVGADEKTMQLINRAVMANSAALRAGTREEKIAAEKERDGILSGIVDDLGNFSGNRFAKAMTEYISNTQKHARALQEHEKTNEELRQQYKERQDREYASRMETWEKTYNVTEQNYVVDETLSTDELKIAKELGIDPDAELKESKQIAKGTLSGKVKVSEAIDIVHRGRVYPILQAKIAIRDKQLKEKDDLIAKLRGSGTKGGDANGTDVVKEKDSEEKTTDNFLHRFRASRIKNI